MPIHTPQETRGLHIWVDADACPVVIKEILYRNAERLKIHTIFVANHFLKLPPSAYLVFRQVQKGFDEADDWIETQVHAEDLVITGDIPLAARVLEKKAWALNPRGEFYTQESIRERLNLRDFMESLRENGLVSGGPSSLNQSHKHEFAGALDRFLAKALKVRPKLAL